MLDASVARRYARALLGAAEEAQAIEPVQNDLAALAAHIDESPVLGGLLANPAFAAEERRAVLDKMCDAGQAHRLTKTFLNLLVDKERTAFLPAIAASYQVAADELQGRVRATVTTAAVLDDAALAEIVKGLESRTGKTVVATTTVDPSVIAGVKAQIGGLVFDGTLKTRLDRLESNLTSV